MHCTKQDIERYSFNKQFSKVILSYTNEINRKNNWNGNLFLSCFRRIRIENENHLKRLVYYIHQNPIKHGIVEDVHSYRFCTYKSYLSTKPTNLDREIVFYWFGSKNDFIEHHNYLYDEESIKKFTFEDE